MTLHPVLAIPTNESRITASSDATAQAAARDRERYFLWCEDGDDSGDISIFYATLDHDD